MGSLKLTLTFLKLNVNPIDLFFNFNILLTWELLLLYG